MAFSFSSLAWAICWDIISNEPNVPSSLVRYFSTSSSSFLFSSLSISKLFSNYSFSLVSLLFSLISFSILIIEAILTCSFSSPFFYSSSFSYSFYGFSFSHILVTTANISLSAGELVVAKTFFSGARLTSNWFWTVLVRVRVGYWRVIMQEYNSCCSVFPSSVSLAFEQILNILFSWSILMTASPGTVNLAESKSNETC